MRAAFVCLYCLAFSASYSQEIRWTPMVWYSDSSNGIVRHKVALLVPCKIKGIPRALLLQLDTGADGSSVYDGPRKQFHLPITQVNDRYAFTTVSISIGDYQVDSVHFGVRKDGGDTLAENDRYPVLGTLGQDFLVGKVLLLDFPHDRFAICDSTAGADFPSTASFVPIIRRNNKLFLTIQIGDTVSSDFFFDTGASMFPVETTLGMWQKLTGMRGNEKLLTRVEAPSWGKMCIELGAPIRGGIKLGSLTVPHPLAYFDSAKINDFTTWPFKADGLIGNVLFYDDYLVVVDLVRDRFGILKE